MGITTTILSSKFIETTEEVIQEWLTDVDCFGTGDSRKADVHAGIVQDTQADTMEDPWCEYVVSVARTESTGAGALGTESVFKHISVEIGLRCKRRKDDLDLILLGDILDYYFMNATKGRPALGGASIRNANLVGPIEDNSKKYYLRRFFLTGRIRVSNEVPA
jgi:hypothetical protein